MRVGDIPVTLVPWGATAVIAFMISRFAAASARKVRADQTTGPGLISVVTVAAYLLSVLVGAMLWGEPWQAPARWAVVIAVLLLAAWWGSSRSLGVRQTRAARPGAGDHTCRVGGPARHAGGGRGGVGHRSLDASQAGGSVASGAATRRCRRHRAVAPTASVRAECPDLVRLVRARLRDSHLVRARSLPLPPLSWEWSPASRCWARCHPLAPATSCSSGGLLLVRSLEQSRAGWCSVPGQLPRFDQASLAGGACGLLAGAVFAGLAWAASGDLGTLRLADLGPRLFPLLVMAGTTMGLSGLITGLALGLAARVEAGTETVTCAEARASSARLRGSVARRSNARSDFRVARLCVVPEPLAATRWAGQPGSWCWSRVAAPCCRR